MDAILYTKDRIFGFIQKLGIFMNRHRLSRGAELILRHFPKKNGLVVLTFHNIPPKNFEDFEKLITRLKKKYSFIDPKKIAEVNQNEKGIKILLTFDDGFYSNKLIYEKVLKKLNIKACFFVCEDFIDLKKEKCKNFIRDRFNQNISLQAICDCLYYPMGWQDLFNLHLEGNIIGAHTKTHQDLSSIENEYNLLDEIVYSADRIEKKLGVSINSFAYPFGKSINLNKKVLGITKSRFSLAFTNIRGFYHESLNSHLIYRQNIRPDDLLKISEIFATGRADWLYKLDQFRLQKFI